MTCRLTWHDCSPCGCGTPCGYSIDTKIAALQKREAEQEHGQKNWPQEPDWIVELGIGNGRPPIEVHAGGCYAAGKRRRPVPRDEARRLLTSGVRACTHCKPNAHLRILD
ncbi:DUF6233 domain-containing protein [Streptomyces mirabilis]|uniref:DUF6233 domain-containing protein n=1 Tax=Streptomyces mirabilis TaxID=68239 RepID=UPI00225BE419|nr:DUF6233 domain-containing protein [Streptomyces mirabilis]MCX4617785.1 DUF6233 domain-containing protein [Streptomyces mirabilis]